MATSTPVARVSAVIGQASAKGQDGVVRILHVGDLIYASDVLSSGENSRVELVAPDGRTQVLGEHDVLSADAEVFATERPDLADSSLREGGVDADKIVRAVRAGGSLDQLLEETAAGEAGGNAGGGSTFVRLLRISESIDPQAFIYGTSRSGSTDELLTGGFDQQSNTTTIDVRPPSVSTSDTSLSETAEATPGSFVIDAPAGVRSLTIGGSLITEAALLDLSAHPLTVNTAKGRLQIVGFDAATGLLSYSYDPFVQTSQETVLDSIAILVTGKNGVDSSGNTLSFKITDTAPVAHADRAAISEDATPDTVSGNVIRAGAGADTLAGDTVVISGVATGDTGSAAGQVGSSVVGRYGALVLAADGHYTYTLDNARVQVLSAGQTASDIFTYTLTDSDGSTSSTTLTVTITGANDVPVVLVTNTAALTGTLVEAGHLDDGTVVPGVPTATGILRVSDVDAGATHLWSLEGTPSNTYGRLVLGAATGAWTYTLDNTLTATQALREGQSVTEDYVVRVTDEFGAYVKQTITLTITGTNDVPVITNTAASLTGTLVEAGHSDDGTVVAGALTATGTLSASDVDTGATQTWGLQGTPSTTYGTLAFDPATHAWTYTLDNTLAATQALKEGQSVTEGYVVRVTDEFGAYVEQAITVTITGTNDVPVITNTAAALSGTLVEAGHLDDGTAAAGTLTATGTLSASDVDAGATQTWSLQGTPGTTYGTLALDADTGVWTYTLDNTLAATQALKEGQSVTEDYVVRVTDEFGAYVDQTITLTINGTNDVPVIANTALTGTLSEAGHLDDGTALSGTAIATGTLSASDVDAGATQTWSLQGTPSTTYGALAFDPATHAWTYTLDNTLAATQALKEGQSVTEDYVVRVTDEFGAHVEQTITVTITGTNDVPVITNTAAALSGTLVEAGHLDDRTLLAGTPTATGTLSASDVDAGATQTWSLQGTPGTTYGTLALGADTGVWTYTLDNTLAATQALKEGQSVTEDYVARVTDEFGAYVEQTITVTITGTNDLPLAIADVAGVTEDGLDQAGYDDHKVNTTIVAGNVLSNDSDVDAGDMFSVTGVMAGTVPQAGHVGSSLAGLYGTLVLQADGSYIYTLDNTKTSVQELNAGQTESDTFTYTLTDSDGSTSSTTLTVTVTGTNDGVTLNVADVNAQASGDLSVVETGTASGSFTLSAADGLDATAALTIAGTAVSKAALLGSGTTPVVIDTPQGQLTLTGYNAATGVVSYSYDPSGVSKNHTAGEVLDAITLVVKDDSGDSQNATLRVNILDTAPVARPDAAAVTEDWTVGGVLVNMASGNVISGSGADTLGGDPAEVSGVAAGNIGSAAGQLNSAVLGTCGSLTLAANGSYTYTLDNSRPKVQALAVGQTASDIFTYTMTDSDGDISSTTLTVTVTGTNDAPLISVGSGDRLAASLTESDSALTAQGTLSVSDVDTTDTVTATKLNFNDPTNFLNRLVVGGSYSGPLPSEAALLAMFTASGGEPSTVQQSNPHGISWGFDSGSETFNFLPSGQTLTLIYSVLATDIHGAFTYMPVTITITGTNDVAVIRDDSTSGTEDAGVSGNVFANDTLDPDSNEATTVLYFTVDGDLVQHAAGLPVTLYSASNDAIGSFVLNANGSYSFMPQDHNYSGPLPVITYHAGSTNAGGTIDAGQATLTLTVTPVADAPLLAHGSAPLVTDEDAAVSLGLKAPIVADAVDRNGAGVGSDNPERLSLITLSGIPSGAKLLDGVNSNFELLSSTGAPITIFLTDAVNLIASPGAATLSMSIAQFEALQLLPAADSGSNPKIIMAVTEYEVDNAGIPLPGLIGATASTSVTVNVQAVTDLVDLKINGLDGSYDATVDEDTPLNLSALLSATFRDLDGSEVRSITIGNPLGNGDIVVNGTTVSAGHSITINAPALKTSTTGFPPISIKGGSNFSGDLNGLTVKLNAKDSDADSVVSTQIQSDSVTLNLHVIPLAGDVLITKAPTLEGTAVKFLQYVTLSDGDGSESFTAIKINTLAAGWVLRDETGSVVFTGDGTASYTIPSAKFVNGAFRNLTLTPPGHSSADTPISLTITMTDEKIVNGQLESDTRTVTLDQLITVSPQAEIVGGDSDGDSHSDLTMNGDFSYTTHGQEDQWFALNSDAFDFKTPWTNQDADEQTFALLTPSIGGALAIGAQFKYSDGSGEHLLSFSGEPLRIPVDALASVQFKAPADLAGTFSIKVEALSIDTDPDAPHTSNSQISGEATLGNVVIEPVADTVSLAVVPIAVGREDTAIPLKIMPSSSDPSETYTVTLSGIPNGVVITYNGVVQSVVNGVLTIADFHSAYVLTLIPPPNSNVDIPLTVSAYAVDSLGGMTSNSQAVDLPLLVDVRGVADPLTVHVHSPAQTSEAAVESGSQRISLASALTSIVASDSDGSETISLVISGVPAGVTLEGLSFMGGIGAAREWSGTPAEIANAHALVLTANYSGTMTLNVRAVSTENDGSSWVGATIPIRIEVAPTPEMTLTTITQAREDILTLVDLAKHFQNGDSNESLSSVWVSVASLVGKPFTLHLGSVELGTALTADGGWYKLTAAQAGELYVKGAANSDGDGDFAIKYEISDRSIDGSLSTVMQFDATHSVQVRAVTDATASSNDYTGGVITSAMVIDVNVPVTQQPDANAGDAPDTDGSERLMHFTIDGVPQGVSVVGGHYIGNTPGNSNTARWILDTPSLTFNGSETLNQTIRFALDGTSLQLSSLNQQISILAHTQDNGAAVRYSETHWQLQTAANFNATQTPPSMPAAIIDQWVVDPLPVSRFEDAPVSLNSLVDAQITGSSPYAITVSGLPQGSTVSGMVLTVLNGENVWTASGGGDNASLQTLLSQISIASPLNWNDNHGPFNFSTTLTTYDEGGGTRLDSSLAFAEHLTPMSDPLTLLTSSADIAEGGAATINLTLSNPGDGSYSRVVDGEVYVRVDESGMNAPGGVVRFNGTTVSATVVSGVALIPDGTYYILTGVGSTDHLSLDYQPAGNDSGGIAYAAYVRGQEVNSATGNMTISSINGSFVVSPVSDGATLDVAPASGQELQMIPLSISASLVDPHEAIASLTLSNVKEGFLVLVGGQLASNLGGGVWGIPLSGGVIPTNISLQAPENWSGVVDPIQVSVWAGETAPGVDALLSTADLNVTVNGVADGILFSAASSSGAEGNVIPLNLNSTMIDADGSETATLTVKGLGAYAAFYVGTNLLDAAHVAYDEATDTYTLDGLAPAQVSSLGLVQAHGSYDLLISGQTTDSPGLPASTSSITNASLHVDIAAQPATAGDDRLLYGDSALNGLGGVDTLVLRLGEDLDFSTLPLAIRPLNFEQIDQMPLGQDHTLNALRAEDVLGMTDAGKSLAILGDAGDTVKLKDIAGGVWNHSGTSSAGGHDFDVYSNTQDAGIRLLIEHLIKQQIE